MHAVSSMFPRLRCEPSGAFHLTIDNLDKPCHRSTDMTWRASGTIKGAASLNRTCSDRYKAVFRSLENKELAATLACTAVQTLPI